MTERIEYPAIFRWSPFDKAYLVELIDFGTHTFGTDMADAYGMAQDLLGNCVANCRADGKPLPVPSENPKRPLKKNETFKKVVLDYDKWRSEAQVLDPAVLDAELV